MSKLSWQQLQVAMNNFHIDNLMSYTDIKTKLKLALKKADQSDEKYSNAKQISKAINDLDHKDDFIQNNQHNQKLFCDVHDNMIKIIGKVKVVNPTTKQLNQLLKTAKQKDPKAIKQFNLRVHKQEHLSTRQAMLEVMGKETELEKQHKK